MSHIKCGPTENLQTHHISYDPEITEEITKEKHIKIHGHGTGSAKGTVFTSKTILGRRKVIKQGGSRYISLPLRWFRINSLNPDKLKLLIIANKDICIVNPDHEAEVYDEISRITKEVKTQKEE